MFGKSDRDPSPGPWDCIENTLQTKPSPKTYTREKPTSSTNGARAIKYPHVQEQNWIPASHPVQKAIPNGSKSLL